MMDEKSGAGKTRGKGCDESAGHAGILSPMVKMVAVYRKDGGIKAFVKSNSVDSKKDDMLDSSGDELLPGIGKGGNDAGSHGWMKQTIARLNGVRAQQDNSTTDQSNSCVARHDVVETMGIVQQKVQKLELEYLRKMEQQSDPLLVSGNQDVFDGADKHYGNVYPLHSSIKSTSLTAESVSEYVDPYPVSSVVDLKEIEKMITNVVESKLCELKENHVLGLQRLLGEQEQYFQKSLDTLAERINERIDAHVQLESRLTDLIKDKVDSASLTDYIQRELHVAKESIHVSLKEIDDSVKRSISEIRSETEQHFSDISCNFDSRVKDLVERIENIDSKIQQISDAVMSDVEPLIENHVAAAMEQFSAHTINMKADVDTVDEIRSAVAGINASIESLKSDMCSLDLRAEQQRDTIMDYVNTGIDEKIREFEVESDFNGAMERTANLFDDFERRLPDLVAQECDGKLGILVMDMVDKSSQDFFRVFEDRLQSIKGSILKQVTSAVELKIGDLTDSPTSGKGTIKNAFCKSVEGSIMELVGKEIDHAIEGIRSEVSDVKDAVCHLESKLGAFAKCKAPVDDCVVDQSVSQIGQMSKELDHKMLAVANVIEECKLCMEHAADVTRHLKEEVASVISRMREAVLVSTQQLDVSRKDSENVMESIRKDLLAVIKESGDLLSALKLVKDDLSISSMPTASYGVPGHMSTHMGATLPVMLDPRPDCRTPVSPTSCMSPCVMKGDRQSHMCSSVFYGMPVPMSKGETPRKFSSIAPMEMTSGSPQHERVVRHIDSPSSDPGKRVEVKYVDMNGQRVKVTQEHVTLSEMARISPVAGQGIRYGQNSVHRQPQMY